MRLLTDVEVQRDRQNGGVSFSHVYVDDEATTKMISLYKVIRRVSSRMDLGVWGVEIYQGPNYVSSRFSTYGDKSYSRHYLRGKGLPDKYKPLVARLKKALGGTFPQV